MLPALVVFAIALTVRFVILAQLESTSPLFANPVIDSMKYDQLARGLAQQSSWPEAGAFSQPPAYPVFLAAVYRVFGSSIAWAKSIQAVIGAVACLLLFFLGSWAGGRMAGLASGLICALYGPLLYFESDLMPTGLLFFFTIAGLCSASASLRQPKAPYFFLTGLFFGLALITWPIAGFLLMGSVAILLWNLRRHRRRAVTAALLLAFGLALPLLPVSIHNYRQGEPVLISSNGGINFYIGNNPKWLETIAVQPGYRWERIVTLPYRVYGPEAVRDAGTSALFTRLAIEALADNPIFYLKNSLLKLAHLGYGFEFMNPTDLYFFKKYSPLLDALVFEKTWLKFPFGLLLPFAVLGIILQHPDHRKTSQLLLANLVLGAGGLLLFYITSRYRLLLLPMLAIFAGRGIAGLPALLTGFNQEKLRNTIRLLLAAAVLLPANLDLFRQQQFFQQPASVAQNFFALGRINLDHDHDREAISWLEKAVATDPGYPDAWVDLGRARYNLGDPNGAIRAMEQARSAAPDYPLPLFNLARIHDARPGGSQLAAAYYQAYIDSAAAYYEQVLRGTNRLDFARKRLNEIARQ